MSNGQQHLVELGLLVVLQHHAFAALGGDDALVVGQVEGRRLHAAVAVARREHGVHDGNRRQGAERRVAVLGVNRQMVLDVLQRAGKLLQLGRFGLVLDGDEGLERGLVVEPLVLVNLVGPDRQLDGRVELHPLHVAVVVVVRQKRRRARVEECLERRLRRGRRRSPQVPGRHGEFALVLDAVGHGHQLPVGAAPDGGEKARGRLTRRAGQRAQPPLHVCLRGIRGIEIRRRRLGRRTGHERRVVVEARPRSLVHQEVAEPRPAERRVISDQRRQQRLVARPHLTQEERVHHLRSSHQVRQCPALGLGQRRHIRRQVGWRKPCRLRGESCHDRVDPFRHHGARRRDIAATATCGHSHRDDSGPHEAQGFGHD